MTVYHGDCREVMAGMDAESIDAIVTDPPYGLEFMGKEWDKLDGGLPQENVWKGRRGNGGGGVGSDDSKPSSRHHVNYGGKHNQFRRCSTCGKRQFSGSPCVCAEPTWELEVAQAAPTSAIRMQRWHEAWAREAYRVAKPGAHLLAFGGTRTYHRLAAAIEDAGWEIRDTLVWAYASGFPKSLDVSKAIDKAAGANREVVGSKIGLPGYHHHPSPATVYGNGRGLADGVDARIAASTITAPATPDAEKWQGWGTALKPAWEPIVLARKPLRGTVAANVLEHGTGALNIDGCRIGTTQDERDWIERTARPNTRGERHEGAVMNRPAEPTVNVSPLGRWPANVILTDPIFDGDTPGVVGGGEAPGAVSNGKRLGNGYAEGFGAMDQVPSFGDSGTYSRFFLVPKASRSDREPKGHKGGGVERGQDGSPVRNARCADCGRVKFAAADARCQCDNPTWVPSGPPRVNTHPTVKPTRLMAHLLRLVTPPGGVVLDPFAGSGSTLVAAEREGIEAIGIEQDAESVAIIRARLDAERTEWERSA